MKKFIKVVLFCVFVFCAGCGEDTDKMREFEALQDIDNGNYKDAIDKLGDCSSYSDKAKCRTNLGAAYFGMARFDILSLGKDLLNIQGDDNKKDRTFNEIVVSKLLDKNLEKGIDQYELILKEANKHKYCNEKDIDKNYMNLREKNACYSINPILLKEALSKNKKAQNKKTDQVVSLKTLIEFKDVLASAAPGVTASELVDIVNKGMGNANEPDKLKATRCALGIGNGCQNLTTHQNVFGTSGRYANIDSVIVSVNSVNYYRLVKKTISGIKTSVSVDTSIHVDKNLNQVSKDVDGVDVFYKPLVKDGKLFTLDESIKDILNNDEKLRSIATLINSQSETSVDEKVSELKKEICGSNNCTITQQSIFDYMKKI